MSSRWRYSFGEADVALEIERKYRVIGDAWRAAAEHSEDLVQGYLNLEGGAITRVRIAGDRAWLNLKGATMDIVRHEFEYPIPLADAWEMLAKLCVGPPVEKRRHHVRHAGCLWEVDEFSGANAGLVVAEIELENENQEFPKPDWVGKEVTDDARYLNANLVKNPYSKWGKK